MITTRTARQCGRADTTDGCRPGILFPLDTTFDPKLLGYASLRVLNQEVLTQGLASGREPIPKSIF